jgi:hypothetical protein
MGFLPSSNSAWLLAERDSGAFAGTNSLDSRVAEIRMKEPDNPWYTEGTKMSGFFVFHMDE